VAMALPGGEGPLSHPPRGALRLMVISNNYPPHTLGGYELLCRDHVAWLTGRGHAVMVVTSRHGTSAAAAGDERGDHGERIRRVLDFHWRDFEHARPAAARLWAGEWRQRRALLRALREQRPQGALVWHMGAISKSLLAVLHGAGVPAVAVVGEPWLLWDIEADAWLSLWRRPAVRRRARLAKPVLRPLAARWVAPTDIDAALAAMRPLYASEHLRREVENGLPAWRDHGAVVPNGINAELFARPRAADAPLRSPLRLLYAGRVEPRKGVHTAIEALASANAAGCASRLTVAGWQDRAYAAELTRRAAELGVDGMVEWLGALPREAMPELYHDHDVLLFPSVWAEPFGLVPLEAMAASCVVVATGTGGSADFLRGGDNCLLVPPQDPDAIVAAILRLRGDPGLVARLRRGGGATLAAHSFDAYAARLEAQLSALINA